MLIYGPRSEQFEQVKEKFSWLRALAPDGWLAGGALRAFHAHESIKDYDIFFKYDEDRQDAEDKFERKDWEPVVRNSTVTRFRKGKTCVDLVHRPFNGPQATVEGFDFTVACAAFDHYKLLVHDDYWYDLAARRLRVNTLPFPVGSLARLQRYAGKGYRACPETLRELALALSQRTEDQIKGEHLYHSID